MKTFQADHLEQVDNKSKVSTKKRDESIPSTWGCDFAFGAVVKEAFPRSTFVHLLACPGLTHCNGPTAGSIHSWLGYLQFMSLHYFHVPEPTKMIKLLVIPKWLNGQKWLLHICWSSNE